MVRSLLAFTLLGLGAVNALPAQQLEDRQTTGGIIGGGISSGGLVPPTSPTFCDFAKPLEEQKGCVTLGGPGIIGGGTITPPKAKRTADEAEAFLRHAKRQITIGKDCDLATVQLILDAVQDIKNPAVRKIVLEELFNSFIAPNIRKCISGTITSDSGVSIGEITPQPTVPGGSIVPEKPSSGGSIYPSP